MLIHTEEEAKFQERLKELCKQYDEKYGSFPDPDFVGASLYYFYCSEHCTERDYIEPEDRDYREEDSIKVEYIESDEPITNIGEMVCPTGCASCHGCVCGIKGDKILANFLEGTFMFERDQLKKVIIKEL